MEKIEYETNCTCIDIQEWEKLMKGAKQFSYSKLKKLIKEQVPELYDSLALDFYNPWEDATKETKTHYILVHSGIEYFFRKVM